MKLSEFWKSQCLPLTDTDTRLVDWLDAAVNRERDEYDSEVLFNLKNRLIALLQNEHLGSL